MKKNIVIIGSTGVLGGKLIKFLQSTNHNISLISCYSNQSKILEIKKKIDPIYAVVLDPSIQKKFDNLYYGDSHVINYIKNNKIDFFYLLDTGFHSLVFLNILIKHQNNCSILIANKEVLVAGGQLLIQSILKSNNKYVPLDSEHFSLIDLTYSDYNIKKNINKIILTASGGPFYFKKNFDINKVNLNMAISHPIWKMGYKNSIDSSNLVNKILESFELASLLNLPLNKIDILISPKAFAHSIVYYSDQRISINCFINNMNIPLTSPFKNENFYKIDKSTFDIRNLNNLSFLKANNSNFEILKYRKKINNFNHSEQIIFMILNSIFVIKFINNKIEYKDIVPFIFKNMNKYPKKNNFKSLYQVIKYTNMISGIIKNV